MIVLTTMCSRGGEGSTAPINIQSIEQVQMRLIKFVLKGSMKFYESPFSSLHQYLTTVALVAGDFWLVDFISNTSGGVKIKAHLYLAPTYTATSE